MLGGRKGILDNVFNKDVDVDLLERVPHRARLDIGQHDKFDVGRGFVVMELVLRGAVGNETAVGQCPFDLGLAKDCSLPVIVPS